MTIPTCHSGPRSPALTTPVPFPPALGLPASRLQDSGILKMEKSASHHVLHFDFANTALCRPHPPRVHSFLVFHPILHVIPHASFPASWSLPVPCPTTAHLLVFLPEIDLSLARGFGVPLGLSPTSDLESVSPFRALSPLTLGTAISRSPFRSFQSGLSGAL